MYVPETMGLAFVEVEQVWKERAWGSSYNTESLLEQGNDKGVLVGAVRTC